jgi:ABC-type sugar transport system substrate-binding protein
VVENGKALTFISGNETAAAEKIGKWVTSAYDGSPQAAVITGTPGNLSADNRTNGFKAGIKGSSAKVVAEGTGNWARDEALRVAGDMLTANPNLDVVFANNDEMAFGALKAIAESGKADKIDTIGWNGTCIGLKAVLDGDFVLEAVLPFDVFGAGLIDTALDDASGKDVPKTISPEVPVITTEQAKAILAGTEQASDVLVSRLREASSGSCK